MAVEAGLLETTDWKARFISPATLGGILTPAPLLTTEWDLPSEIVSARLHVTAHGLYEMSLNGERVGDEYLAPGWTTYSHRLRYQTHDVTDLLHEGANDVRALLGNGWYRGRLTWGNRRALYGTGSPSSPSSRWSPPTAPGTSSAPTTPGARTPGVSSPTTSTTAAPPTCGSPSPRATTPSRSSTPTSACSFAPEGPPVRVTEVVAAQKTWRSPSGARSSTSGRTSSAGCASRVARRGRHATVTLRHAEVLEDGELGIRPLRTAEGHRHLHPRRRRGGGAGSPASPSTASATPRSTAGRASSTRQRSTAVVIHSDMERTGWFECSDAAGQPAARERRLGHARQLPRRAHRLPAARRAARLDRRHPGLRAHRVLPVRLRRLPARPGCATSPLEQAAAGGVPFVVPDVLDSADGAGRGLGRRGGDRAVGAVRALRRRRRPGRASSPSMRRWVDQLLALAGERRPVGRAASSSATGSTRPRRRTSPAERARPTPTSSPPPTSFRSRRAARPAAAARARRRRGRRARYAALAADGARGLRGRVRHPGRPDLSATRRPRTRWRSSSASLTDERSARHAGERLAELVRRDGYRISTGFVGTPLVTRRPDATPATCDDGLPAAAADRVPVLAVPGDDGRHHDLGALGLACCPTARSTPAR